MDEARHCTKLIKTETFCFSELTRKESGRELICPRGTQGGGSRVRGPHVRGLKEREVQCRVPLP